MSDPSHRANPMDHILHQSFDHVLQRRPDSWYLGKVLWVRGPMVPEGWPEGFYIPLRINTDGTYDYHFIGTEQPPGEEIYIHEGRRDLKAVPKTVRPSDGVFILWFAVYLVVAVFFAAVAADSGGWMFLLFLPIAGVPYFQWYMNVEPVRGTKVAAAIVAGEVALAAKHRRDWSKYQADNEKYRP